MKCGVQDLSAYLVKRRETWTIARRSRGKTSSKASEWWPSLMQKSPGSTMLIDKSVSSGIKVASRRISAKFLEEALVVEVKR